MAYYFSFSRSLTYTSLILVFVLLQYKLWFSEEGYLQINTLQQRIAQLRVDNNQFVTRNLRLLSAIDALKTNPQAAEALARSELGLVKDHEIYYHLVED